MKHYAVVLKEYSGNSWAFTYDGRNPFITKDKCKAEIHLQYCQESWPDEKYQIVEFDVKEM